MTVMQGFEQRQKNKTCESRRYFNNNMCFGKLHNTGSDPYECDVL